MSVSRQRPRRWKTSWLYVARYHGLRLRGDHWTVKLSRRLRGNLYCATLWCSGCDVQYDATLIVLKSFGQLYRPVHVLVHLKKELGDFIVQFYVKYAVLKLCSSHQKMCSSKIEILKCGSNTISITVWFRVSPSGEDQVYSRLGCCLNMVLARANSCHTAQPRMTWQTVVFRRLWHWSRSLRASRPLGDLFNCSRHVLVEPLHFSVKTAWRGRGAPFTYGIVAKCHEASRGLSATAGLLV